MTIALKSICLVDLLSFSENMTEHEICHFNIFKILGFVTSRLFLKFVK